MSHHEKVESIMAAHTAIAAQYQVQGRPGFYFVTPRASTFANELAQLIANAYEDGKREAIQAGVLPSIRQLRSLMNGHTPTDEERRLFQDLVRDVNDYVERNELPKGSI